jgi:tRNA (guanine-N7-)-methyltransferase
MSRSGQLNISRTSDIRAPNEYILALQGEFAPWSFDEERAPTCRGLWRQLLSLPEATAVDVELGTGNGFHFADRAIRNPARGLIGFELKYKPLIQSIRRAVRARCKNARIVRYNASLIDQIFAGEEINDVFIHFPDPWEKLSKHKHRMIQDEFLRRLFAVQKPGSKVQFKTDSREYFDWALERFQRSPYQVTGFSYDLHNSEFAADNFVTHFESLFVRKGLPIHFAELRKG